MFKKAPSWKAQTLLRSSDRRILVFEVLRQYPALNSPDSSTPLADKEAAEELDRLTLEDRPAEPARDIVPEKISATRFVAKNGHQGVLYATTEGEPVWIRLKNMEPWGEVILPTGRHML